jgi:hypothetical protein
VRDAVDVDVGSAVVSYRPTASEERSASADEVSSGVLFAAAPWRTFRWYFGQRHYSGTYWSATQCDHVIYESRLELANLLLAEFDPAVRQIVAQPFLLCAEVGGRLLRYIPDYLWDTEDGPVVVDVVRNERMVQSKVVFLSAWTRQIVEALGWTYLVVNEPPRIRLANTRFLAGYRRDWLISTSILDEIRSCSCQLVGMPIADAERAIEGSPRQLVRPAIFNLLWRHEFRVVRPYSRPRERLVSRKTSTFSCSDVTVRSFSTTVSSSSARPDGFPTSLMGRES